MKRVIVVCACFVLLAIASGARAQILSRGDLFGPGAPPPMIGLNIGLGEHTQQGTFQGNCNCTFENGTGSGLWGMALFELPLDYEWALGIMAGLDFKNFSGVEGINEAAIVEYTQNAVEQVDTISLPLQRTSKVKTTYLSFLPYVQYQFFRMGPFLQGGVNIGYLIGSDFIQTRDLISDQTPDGKVQNLRFQSTGTKSEQLQEENPINNVNKIRLAIDVSAGYNVAVSEKSVFSPLLTYDLPLTTIRNTLAANWKVGSLYASAVLKFRLD